MLAAVSGLAYLISTVLKIENTVGYFLPLPVVLACMRSGVGSGWKTMMATAFLLVGECGSAVRIFTRQASLLMNCLVPPASLIRSLPFLVLVASPSAPLL